MTVHPRQSDDVQNKGGALMTTRRRKLGGISFRNSALRQKSKKEYGTFFALSYLLAWRKVGSEQRIVASPGICEVQTRRYDSKFQMGRR